MTRSQQFHRDSLEHRDEFWAEQAALVDWHKPFDQVLDYSRPPFAKWFTGGELNLCHNSVDRHLPERANQPALIFVSTETNTEQVFTYGQLHAEVQHGGYLSDTRGNQGPPRPDLHAHDPGSHFRHARHRASGRAH